MKMPAHVTSRFVFDLSDAASDPPFTWRCRVYDARGVEVKSMVVGAKDVLGSEEAVDSILAKLHAVATT